jgi:hypothetical protein
MKLNSNLSFGSLLIFNFGRAAFGQNFDVILGCVMTVSILKYEFI